MGRKRKHNVISLDDDDDAEGELKVVGVFNKAMADQQQTAKDMLAVHEKHTAALEARNQIQIDIHERSLQAAREKERRDFISTLVCRNGKSLSEAKVLARELFESP